MSGNFSVDFASKDGRIRKELYGSGMHVFISNRRIADTFDSFKNLRFPAVRNHDWALNNSGQRMIDTHFVFPLEHLDPSDERNYVFGPSDEAIRLVYEAGSKVLYRLGTSIEHTKDWHFNANPPKDANHFAEVCSGIIRHYTQGWCNGFHYDMKYWEIWNEPEGHISMWTGTDEEFAKFFAIVLKRLKDEFPELKIGGPANCYFRTDYIDLLKAECDKLGVKPDFYSYHMYANELETPRQSSFDAREYLDKIGWNGVELCLNEWHFIRAWEGVQSNVTEESWRRTNDGRDGLIGINSAAFNIATFCIWQNSPLDSAYYYGCGIGGWGLMRPSRRFNKNYYSLLFMRDMVYDYPEKVALEGGTETQRAIAGLSEDGTKAAVLVSDFCGPEMEIKVAVKGFENPTSAKVVLLDDIYDNEESDIALGEDGFYHLKKKEPGAAVFMLKLAK